MPDPNFFGGKVAYSENDGDYTEVDGGAGALRRRELPGPAGHADALELPHARRLPT